MLQGPSILTSNCSNHICPIGVQIISPAHHLHGECIHYHNRVVEVSASFTRTPQGVQHTNTCPHSHTLITQKFLPFLCQPLTTDMLWWQSGWWRGNAWTCKNQILAKFGCQSYASQSRTGVCKACHGLGTTSPRIAWNRILHIIPNITPSQVSSNQSTTWFLLTRTLSTPSSHSALLILHS